MILEKKKQKMLSKRIGYPFFILLLFLFFFFQLTGRDLAEAGNILWTGRYTLELMGKCLLFALPVGGGLCFLFYRLGSRDGENFLYHPVLVHERKAYLIKTAVYFLSVLLCWVPGYLAYFPAICAYDTPVQMGQIMDGYMIDHHPIAHTLILKGCVGLGEGLFESVTVGVGIYAFLQMLLLAGAFTYGLMALEEAGVRRRFIVPIWIYSMIFPFHLYMSVSMTKDTVFSAFFLIQLTAFCKLLREKRNTIRPQSRDMVYLAAAIGMILFRNNGRYAMLVLLGIQLLTLVFAKAQRKLWTRLFLNSLAGFVLGSLLLSGLFAVTNAEQGDRREMLSIPIQQFARTMVYHGGVGVLPEDDNTMQEVDKALINDFILNEAWRDYKPDLADPVKKHTNTYVARYRFGDFVRTYFRLLGQYPGDFINAFLSVNAGYLYVNDTSHATINAEEGRTGRGYIQTEWMEELNTRGLYKDSKWEWLHQVMEVWADENAYLKIPVLKYLFVPGSYLWLYLLFLGYLFLRKRFAMCLPLSLAAGYYGTLLLGPTVQMRYIYPLMIVLPFLVLLQGQSKEDGKGTGIADV